METKKDNSTNKYPPVVSVLGHVDHGKTTLLDKIRETGVAARERGGITQKIGASKIEIEHEGNKRTITLIDTPGHEAFANMRAQGVSASDIVLLIISADDGIMPQTRESIQKIIEAKCPFIVVFTKIDKEGANIERVKQQVIKEGILLEGLGGDVPYIGVSAATGENIKELLDLILLVYDVSNIKKDGDATFMGVVIDAKQEKRSGILSSIIVKQGMFRIGSNLYVHGRQIGKVKAIVDSMGSKITEVAPGDGCEILGLNEVVPAGTVLFDQEVEPIVAPVHSVAKQMPVSLAEFLSDDKKDIVPIILKTETSAEMEAVKYSLPEKIKVIYEGQGEIAASDILMAKDFRALVIGFNVKVSKEAMRLADVEKVFTKTYGIIYELLDELLQLIVAVTTIPSEKEIGKGEILASFLGTTGVIIGVKVIEGRLAVNDRIKIFRGDKEIGSTVINSLKKGKNDAKLAGANEECGVMIGDTIDFRDGDAIIAYSKK